MCLPSSLLKAGSQLHGSRDSAEAEAPSPVRGEAWLRWPPAGRVCALLGGRGEASRGPGGDRLLCPTPCNL